MSYRFGWFRGMSEVKSVGNHPGNMALDWMLSLAQADGKALGELHQAALAGGIRRPAAAAAEYGKHGADVDNLAAGRAVSDSRWEAGMTGCETGGDSALHKGRE